MGLDTYGPSWLQACETSAVPGACPLHNQLALALFKGCCRRKTLTCWRASGGAHLRVHSSRKSSGIAAPRSSIACTSPWKVACGQGHRGDAVLRLALFVSQPFLSWLRGSALMLPALFILLEAATALLCLQQSSASSKKCKGVG